MASKHATHRFTSRHGESVRPAPSPCISRTARAKANILAKAAAAKSKPSTGSIRSSSGWGSTSKQGESVFSMSTCSTADTDGRDDLGEERSQELSVAEYGSFVSSRQAQLKQLREMEKPVFDESWIYGQPMSQTHEALRKRARARKDGSRTRGTSSESEESDDDHNANLGLWTPDKGDDHKKKKVSLGKILWFRLRELLNLKCTRRLVAATKMRACFEDVVDQVRRVNQAEKSMQSLYKLSDHWAVFNYDVQSTRYKAQCESLNNMRKMTEVFDQLVEEEALPRATQSYITLFSISKGSRQLDSDLNTILETRKEDNEVLDQSRHYQKVVQHKYKKVMGRVVATLQQTCGKLLKAYQDCVGDCRAITRERKRRHKTHTEYCEEVWDLQNKIKQCKQHIAELEDVRVRTEKAEVARIEQLRANIRICDRGIDSLNQKLKHEQLRKTGQKSMVDSKMELKIRNSLDNMLDKRRARLEALHDQAMRAHEAAREALTEEMEGLQTKIDVLEGDKGALLSYRALADRILEIVEAKVLNVEMQLRARELNPDGSLKGVPEEEQTWADVPRDGTLQILASELHFQQHWLCAREQVFQMDNETLTLFQEADEVALPSWFTSQVRHMISEIDIHNRLEIMVMWGKFANQRLSTNFEILSRGSGKTLENIPKFWLGVQADKPVPQKAQKRRSSVPTRMAITSAHEIMSTTAVAFAPDREAASLWELKKLAKAIDELNTSWVLWKLSYLSLATAPLKAVMAILETLVLDVQDAMKILEACIFPFCEAADVTGAYEELARSSLLWLPSLAAKVSRRTGTLRALVGILNDNAIMKTDVSVLCTVISAEITILEPVVSVEVLEIAEEFQERLAQCVQFRKESQEYSHHAVAWWCGGETALSTGQPPCPVELEDEVLEKGFKLVEQTLLQQNVIDDRTMMTAELFHAVREGLANLYKAVEPDAYNVAMCALSFLETTVYDEQERLASEATSGLDSSLSSSEEESEEEASSYGESEESSEMTSLATEPDPEEDHKGQSAEVAEDEFFEGSAALPQINEHISFEHLEQEMLHRAAHVDSDIRAEDIFKRSDSAADQSTRPPSTRPPTQARHSHGLSPGSPHSRPSTGFHLHTHPETSPELGTEQDSRPSSRQQRHSKRKSVSAGGRPPSAVDDARRSATPDGEEEAKLSRRLSRRLSRLTPDNLEGHLGRETSRRKRHRHAGIASEDTKMASRPERRRSALARKTAILAGLLPTFFAATEKYVERVVLRSVCKKWDPDVIINPNRRGALDFNAGDDEVPPGDKLLYQAYTTRMLKKAMVTAALREYARQTDVRRKASIADEINMLKLGPGAQRKGSMASPRRFSHESVNEDALRSMVVESEHEQRQKRLSEKRNTPNRLDNVMEEPRERKIMPVNAVTTDIVANILGKLDGGTRRTSIAPRVAGPTASPSGGSTRKTAPTSPTSPTQQELGGKTPRLYRGSTRALTFANRQSTERQTPDLQFGSLQKQSLHPDLLQARRTSAKEAVQKAAAAVGRRVSVFKGAVEAIATSAQREAAVVEEEQPKQPESPTRTRARPRMPQVDAASRKSVFQMLAERTHVGASPMSRSPGLASETSQSEDETSAAAANLKRGTWMKLPAHAVDAMAAQHDLQKLASGMLQLGSSQDAGAGRRLSHARLHPPGRLLERRPSEEKDKDSLMGESSEMIDLFDEDVASITSEFVARNVSMQAHSRSTLVVPLEKIDSTTEQPPGEQPPQKPVRKQRYSVTPLPSARSISHKSTFTNLICSRPSTVQGSPEASQETADFSGLDQAQASFKDWIITIDKKAGETLGMRLQNIGHHGLYIADLNKQGLVCKHNSSQDNEDNVVEVGDYVLECNGVPYDDDKMIDQMQHCNTLHIKMRRRLAQPMDLSFWQKTIKRSEPLHSAQVLAQLKKRKLEQKLEEARAAEDKMVRRRSSGTGPYARPMSVLEQNVVRAPQDQNQMFLLPDIVADRLIPHQRSASTQPTGEPTPRVLVAQAASNISTPIAPLQGSARNVVQAMRTSRVSAAEATGVEDQLKILVAQQMQACPWVENIGKRLDQTPSPAPLQKYRPRAGTYEAHSSLQEGILMDPTSGHTMRGTPGPFIRALGGRDPRGILSEEAISEMFRPQSSLQAELASLSPTSGAATRLAPSGLGIVKGLVAEALKESSPCSSADVSPKSPRLLVKGSGQGGGASPRRDEYRPHLDRGKCPASVLGL
eukprot:TRINITY_DN30931_c0_g1_i1.p1 TRINITY_DN30931_c0_g1~~TRINITY_DN30931_c0_g1_i1.p1  ORF type:complete len:2219 (-),score=445.49 TRINITY_DN30931_c0_g1_i1:247-6903(-)